MSRTFTTATDGKLIELIQSASNRLIVVAPGLTAPVAEALENRIGDLSALSLTVILDADPEVYRIGYGDMEALESIRKASSEQMFDLREQSGVRIGLVISDHRTMIYSPVPRNVEADSTTDQKPNALVIEGEASETLAQATALAGPQTEIGRTGMKPERVAEMVENLKADPPQPFDLSRKLKVFRSGPGSRGRLPTRGSHSSEHARLTHSAPRIMVSLLNGTRCARRVPRGGGSFSAGV